VADRFASIKRLLVGKVTAVTTPGALRGRDFMRADLTHGADRAEY
jgi:hypothetical protein